MAEKKWQHDELAHDLAQSLRVNPEHIVWENMQMGPSGSIRPDVYLLKKRYSTFAPVTYEVKVSVSDFRSDITSGKWQGYLGFSSAVIFAVPAGLISKDDVPAGCGLIVRHDEVWRMVKKPTMQHIETLSREAWLKLVIDGIDRAVAQRDEPRVRHAPHAWGVQQVIRKKVGGEIAELVSIAMKAREGVQQAIERAEEQRREITEGTHRELKWARERIESESERLSGELRDLAKALGLAEDVSVRSLTSALESAVRRLQGDAEVQRLRNLFERIQSATVDGMRPLPGEQISLPAVG
ncbi:MmcB family DNA repair protein [Pseudomonas nitroreducens]|uniref:MmcB family DNA repair protein n=1 Tax=Pseudomonas nitroreducens TaxID=46680 RepID=A0A5R8ZRE2_PSENT|nr:MmcB family DNA repair protein [Pseudomonas nitroreducens]TLP68219.1 MmcB family DNA repair protein [Pseudomonas nitroreducens]